MRSGGRFEVASEASPAWHGMISGYNPAVNAGGFPRASEERGVLTEDAVSKSGAAGAASLGRSPHTGIPTLGGVSGLPWSCLKASARNSRRREAVGGAANGSISGPKTS